MMPKLRQRGAVLIVVLGVLVVLALLATTFATLQGVERSVSRNYLDEIRSNLLAQSGVEFAVSELRKNAETGLLPRPGPQPWRFWGNNANETGSASLNRPLETATNPSFAYEWDNDPGNETPTPFPVLIEGRWTGISGYMESGTYGRYADVYHLKVTDSASKIFVNEGVTHYGGNASSASLNLRRILNQLGAVNTVNVPGLGDLVLNNRPQGGYHSVRDLRKFLTATQYDNVADFVTTHAWVDPDVVNPAHYSAEHASTAPVQFWRGDPASIYRYGRGLDYRGLPVTAPLRIFPSTQNVAWLPQSLSHAVYAMDELNPQWIEVTSRAPVNVNEARREVLIALLSDLRGVFLSERRRNNIDTRRVGGYHFLKIKHTYSPDKMPLPPERPYPYYNVQEGDELGFLYETWPIVGPASSGSGISAVEIAEHLLACREMRATSGATIAFDYSNPALTFRGPFRHWRQFNEFCDHLAAIGVLEDPRGKAGGPPPVFFDYNPSSFSFGNITGNAAAIPSDFQRSVASRAIADVLKANFNPNLHLNELNPDRNTFLLVDKTDLTVHSTEFCFTPTGHFDIESVGRVLRPTWGDIALAFGCNNKVVAEAKVHAGVKLYDLVRETSQAQFSRGTCSDRDWGSWATNNNRSLEVGPEPDNGNGPKENRWSGYLAYPTVGGNYTSVGMTKSKDSLLPTADSSGEMCNWNDTIHSHLAWDFDAHHHQDNKRKDLGSHDYGANEKVINYPDRTEGTVSPGEIVAANSVCGPYDPVDGNNNLGNRYRLARSFTLPTTTGQSQSLPTISETAPLDLRIDGGYLERHSGLAYWISQMSYVPNAAVKTGIFSYWVKPNFFPERSGKPRGYLDMNRKIVTPFRYITDPVWGDTCDSASFIHFWTPGHDAVAGSQSPNHDQNAWNEVVQWGTGQWGPQPFKPESLMFGVAYGWATDFAPSTTWCNYYQFLVSPSLNHEAHGHNPAIASTFKGHEWTHVILSWEKLSSPQSVNGTGGQNLASIQPMTYIILVNGKFSSASVHVQFNNRPLALLDTLRDWTVHCNGDLNALRVGAPSLAHSIPNGTGTKTSYNNFSADSTLDEIYFWNSNTYEAMASNHWLLGRYSFPKSSVEGEFVSQEIDLGSYEDRGLPPVSDDSPPVPSGPNPQAGSGNGVTMSMPVPEIRILGISWTWYGERNAMTGGQWTPVLTDHGDLANPANPPIPRIDASISSPTTSISVTDDGYSPLFAIGGQPLVLPMGSKIRYRLKCSLQGADPNNTILLATPVIDDVTIYYATDRSPFLYYFHDAAAK